MDIDNDQMITIEEIADIIGLEEEEIDSEGEIVIDEKKRKIKEGLERVLREYDQD